MVPGIPEEGVGRGSDEGGGIRMGEGVCSHRRGTRTGAATELDKGRGAEHDLPAIGQRIDLADLKERIRKLEAIAAGVDL